MMNRLLFVISMLVIMLFGPITSQAKLLFYDDCEDRWNDRDWYAKPYNNTISVSSERARAGSKSYKFTQGPVKEEGYESHVELLLSAVRNELGTRNFPYNKEFWIGYSIYLPSDFTTPFEPSNHGLTTQFHSSGDECDNSVSNGPTGAFFYTAKQGQWRIYTQSVVAECTANTKDYIKNGYAAYTPGKWHDIVIHLKFDYRASNNPFFHVWVDGVKVFESNEPNCWNDTRGPRMHIGIYSHTSRWLTVYYDEIRIGDANSSYAEVAPKGSRQPVMEPPATLRLHGD